MIHIFLLNMFKFNILYAESWYKILSLPYLISPRISLHFTVCIYTSESNFIYPPSVLF